MQRVYHFYWIALFYFWCVTPMCLYLLSWKIAFTRNIQMQEGLGVNTPSAVGKQWPSRGEICSKDLGGPLPTAVPATNWACWVGPPNAAPRKNHLTCFHMWLRSGNNLVVLCAINSNKYPAEDQLNLISPPYGLINELSPAAYLPAPGADVLHRNVLGGDNPAPGGHDPIQVIPNARGYLWQKILTAYGMGHWWAVPNISHLGWILENTQVPPHVHTSRI